MKLNKILAMAVPALMLAACSNDTIGPNDGNQQGESGEGKYLAVTINLPTQTGTRGVNDNYHDGTENEYLVRNGCLVIFQGQNEATAKFQTAYDLQALNGNFDNDGKDIYDNITSTYVKTIELSGLDNVEDKGETDPNKIFAFVMLNYTGVAEVTSDNGLKVGAKTISKGSDNSTFTDIFNDINNLVTEESQAFVEGQGKNASNFFMCNAPLSYAVGGTTATAPEAENITTLRPLEKNCIKNTKAEAEASPAGSIYVERGVAKATLTWGTEENSIKGFSGNNVAGLDKDGNKIATNDITFNYIGWALDVKETTSYIARNVKGADWWNLTKTGAGNYRFVGSVKMGTTSLQPEEDLWRTYWCYDPHYNVDLDYTGNVLHEPGSKDENGKEYPNLFDKTNPLYCFENTFDLAHQNYKNTTRAVFQVTLNIGDENGRFWVKDGDESTIYVKESDILSYFEKPIIESDYVSNRLKTVLKPSGDAANPTTLTTDEITPLLHFDYTRSEKTGIKTVKDVSFVDDEIQKLIASGKLTSAPAALEYLIDESGNVTTTKDPLYEALLDRVNKSTTIEEYLNGNTYYDLRFQHFGDDYTPWTKPVDEQGKEINANSTGIAYGENNADYLGRWGMVRNNWYEIEITGVKHLGSPVIPDATVTTSDDKNEIKKYLSFRINVLSWAKRTQRHEF